MNFEHLSGQMLTIRSVQVSAGSVRTGQGKGLEYVHVLAALGHLTLQISIYTFMVTYEWAFLKP